MLSVQKSGVFRVYDKMNLKGSCFVGFSFNLDGIIKRLRFELTLNSCSYKTLQDFYSKCQSPELEVLYAFESELDSNDIEAQARLKAKQFSCAEELEKSGIKVYYIQEQ